MNRIRSLAFSLIVIVSVALQACTKEDNLSSRQTDLKVTIAKPAEVPNMVINNGTLLITEVNTGETNTVTDFSDNQLIITLSEGAYDITFEGEIEYQLNDQNLTAAVSGGQWGLELNGPTAITTIDLVLKTEEEE